MTLRPCARCGRPRPPHRCPACGWADANHRPTRRPDLLTAEHRHRRAALLERHVATHGYRCPGWPADHGWHDADPHANPLTADHTTPHAHQEGPADACLCRACNSRKGATT